jgi:RHS repeat-associated protein
LAHWESAWKVAKDQSDAPAREVASKAVAGWTRLLGSLGRIEEQTALFAEAKRLGLDRGAQAPYLQATREGHETMKRRPEISYRCGSYALGQVVKCLQPTNEAWKTIHAMSSPDGGFQMSQLVDLAGTNGYAMVAARRERGDEILVPAVVHWKLDHYAAVLEKKGDFYRVIDPTFGGEKWLHVEAINAEASGDFLIASTNLPAGWRELSRAEAALIRGKGYPNIIDDTDDDNDEDDDDDCPPSPPEAGDGPGAGDGDPCPDEAGMPRWRISEPYISLWLHDTPLFYRQANGRPFQLKLSYNQRATSTGTNVPGFGYKWQCNWLGMLEETPTSPPGGPIVNIINYHAGGGQSQLPASGANEYKSGFSLQTCSASGCSSGGGNTYTGGAEAMLLYTPLGREIRYGFPLPYASGVVRYFRTNRMDQYLRSVKFNYVSNYVNGATVFQMTYVTDKDRRQSTLAYTNANFPNQITSVTDPYGRSARFFYNNVGLLTNITDMAGMSSSFQYDTDGSITNLTTPYGTNSFRHFAGANSFCAFNRAIEITEPAGVKQLYAYHDNSPTTIGEYYPIDGYAHFRNSYHWNRQQYAALTATGKTNVLGMPDEDYPKGSVKHWSHGPDFTAVTGTLLDMAGPVTDPTSSARVDSVGFQYEGQPAPYFQGTMKRITTIIWDNSADQKYIPRNSWGRPTQFINYRNGTTATYTNEFNADGRILKRVWGPNGESLRGYGYHATLTNLLTSVTNDLGEVLQYTHDATQRVTSITRPSGLVTTNTYYSSGTYAGFLQTRVDTGFRTNSYSYLNGNILVQTNELGLVITNTWDALNRLISVQYPDGTTISNVYDKLDRVATKDRLNQWTYFGYNSLRQLTAVTNANNQFTLYDYCNCGSPSEIRQWNGSAFLTTTYAYDLAGRRTNVTYADGYFMNYIYDSTWPVAGSTAWIQDASGLVVHLGNTDYGQLANVGLSQNPGGSPDGYLMQRTFDNYGRLATMTDRNGVTVTNAYDPLGRLTNHVTLDIYGYQSNSVSYAYTARGLTNSTDELGHQTWFVYDAAGRSLSQTNANNELLQFTYNPADQMLTLKDGKNQQTSWNYDEYGRVTNKLDATSTVIFRYKYDPEDRLTNRWTVAKGDTFYGYDPIGNLTNVDYPGTVMDIALKYDLLNRLTNVTDLIGTTKFSYTDGGQLLSEDGPWTDDTVSYSYSARRRAGLSVTQPNASPWTQGYAYDQYNRLTNIVSAAGNFVYTYLTGGLSDRVNYLTLPGQNYGSGVDIENQFDPLARLSSTTLRNNSLALNQHSYAMNEANRRTKQTFYDGNADANTHYTDYTYDGIGQLQAARGTDRAYDYSVYDYVEAPRKHEQFGYAYDAAWNLNRRTNNALVQSFSVNNLNELTNAARSGTLTVAGQATEPKGGYVSWGYPAGVTNVVVSGTGLSTGNADLYADGAWAKTNATLANGNNTYTATATDTYSRTATDSLTVNLPATNTFSYDGNGNLTNDGRRVFEYDFENLLTNVYVASAWRSEFKYDAFGRRRIRREYTWQSSAWVVTNEVRYVYDGMLVAQERDANNVALVSYTRGNDLSGELQGAGGIGGLLARTDNGQLIAGNTSAHAYYHADGNGNITMLLNTNGSVVARYSYDPYGNLLGMSGPLAEANIYRFSSKEWCANAGLYYYGFRFYEPNLQRWPTRDPLGDAGFLPVLSVDFLPWVDREGDDNDALADEETLRSFARVNQNLHAFALNSPINHFDAVGLECDAGLGPGSLNPENLTALDTRTTAEIIQAKLKRAVLDKIQGSKVFGNGLKGSRNIDPSKLKQLLNKDELKQAADIAKNGMRKASEQIKNAASRQSREAAQKAFETQMNRLNACNKALK